MGLWASFPQDKDTAHPWFANKGPPTLKEEPDQNHIHTLGPCSLASASFASALARIKRGPTICFWNPKPRGGWRLKKQAAGLEKQGPHIEICSDLHGF